MESKQIEVWNIEGKGYINVPDARYYLGVSLAILYRLALMSEIKHKVFEPRRLMIDWESVKSYAMNHPSKSNRQIQVIDNPPELEAAS